MTKPLSEMLETIAPEYLNEIRGDDDRYICTVVDLSSYDTMRRVAVELAKACEFYAKDINWNHGAIDGIAEAFIRRSDLYPTKTTTKLPYGMAIRDFNGGKIANEAISRAKETLGGVK